MITIVLSLCPPQLRGYLTRWLIEVDTLVYVGKVNAKLREEIWKVVVKYIKKGRAIMTYPSSQKEQGFDIRTHNSQWKIENLDGFTVMLRPKTSTEKMTDHSPEDIP